MNSTTQESTRATADRSRSRRATVKRYYIYVVLLFIVVIFSLLKLDEVPMFGRGHFLGRGLVAVGRQHGQLPVAEPSHDEAANDAEHRRRYEH